MAQLATSSLIRGRQEVSITATMSSTGTTTYTATIAPVKTDRTLIEILSDGGGMENGASNRLYCEAGAELQDAATVKLTVNATGVGGIQTRTFKIQVTELASKPRSLQTISGNGTTSQTISTVDPAKALILKGYCYPTVSYALTHPSLGASAVTWSNPAPAAFRCQVVQFN